jgi:hypothetical protein
MTLKSKHNLTVDSGLIASVICSHINDKISQQLTMPRPDETDHRQIFLSHGPAPEISLIKYVKDDFGSFQKLKRAVVVWSSLPEESRLLILNGFLGKIRSVNAGKPQKELVLIFCGIFLTELVPFLSMCDN